MQHKYLKYCSNSRLCWLEMDVQETLASFNLILTDFESEIMTVGSGHGRETRSVRTVLSVPPCTHPESACSENRNSESTQNQRANSQCDVPIACKPSAAHRTSQSSDTYGIFDAFFAFVGGAESSGHLGNLCFTHFWFRLPFVASTAFFSSPCGQGELLLRCRRKALGSPSRHHCWWPFLFCCHEA